MSRPKKCTEGDTLIAGPTLPNGCRPFVRHQPDCKMVSGVMRPLKEGEAIHANCFYLKRREDSDVYDVEDVGLPAAKGPCKASTPAFRAGWDRVFGDVETPEA